MSNFNAELGKNIAKFQFLCDVPSPEVHPLRDDQCSICQEPYQNNGWKFGSTLHRPVKLPCGHVLGYQCLARWILSAGFVDSCPLCRKHIVKTRGSTTRRHQLKRLVATSLARLESIALIASNGVSLTQKNNLLSALKSDLWGERNFWCSPDEGDRIMVASEEFLNVICHGSLALDQRQPSNTQAVAPPPGGNGVALVLPKRVIRAALFFTAAGTVYVPAGVFWDMYNGRSDTFTANVLSLSTYLSSWLILLTIALAGPRCEHMSPGLGMIFGGLLMLAVRHIDALIYEWWMTGLYVVESQTRLW